MATTALATCRTVFTPPPIDRRNGQVHFVDQPARRYVLGQGEALFAYLHLRELGFRVVEPDGGGDHLVLVRERQ